MHWQQRLYPAAALRVAIRPCPCDRYCGGWALYVTLTDDPSCFPSAYTVEYEHLSRGEAMDVIDASWEDLIGR